MRGMGRVFKRKGSAAWWIGFYVNGKEVRESSRSIRRRDAERLLRQRQREIGAGRFVGPAQERVKFAEILDGLETDYEVNRRKSLDTLKSRLKPIREAFALMRAVDVDEVRIERYKRDRLESRAAPATVNRELAAIRRAFRIAVKQKRLSSMPNIETLREHNVREGFFEPHEVRAVLAQLPERVRAAVEFAYLTGWRKSEVFGLQWKSVDFGAGVARLEPGTTKNSEGRSFPFGALPALRDVLVRQRDLTDDVEREQARVIPWVFHDRGEPLRDIRKAWRAACRDAHVPGKLFHDLRRTAVRNLERAGVPRSVAMKLTGHKTESVYRRYAIVAEADLRDGVAKLAALARDGQHGQNADSSGDEGGQRTQRTVG